MGPRDYTSCTALQLCCFLQGKDVTVTWSCCLSAANHASIYKTRRLSMLSYHRVLQGSCELCCGLAVTPNPTGSPHRHPQRCRTAGMCLSQCLMKAAGSEMKKNPPVISNSWRCVKNQLLYLQTYKSGTPTKPPGLGWGGKAAAEGQKGPQVKKFMPNSIP